MTHSVKSGETLGTIAQKYLGSSSRWKEIWNANPQITNPDIIYVGQVLNIPEVYGPSLPPGYVAPVSTSVPTVSSLFPTITPSYSAPKASSGGSSVMNMLSDPKFMVAAAAGSLLLIMMMTRKPKAQA